MHTTTMTEHDRAVETYVAASGRSYDKVLDPSEEAAARRWARRAPYQMLRDRIDWLNTFDPDGFDGEPDMVADAEARRAPLEARYGWKRVWS